MIKGKISECTREWEDEALFYMCPSCASLLHSPRGLLTSQNCDPNLELSIKVSPSKDCSECIAVSLSRGSFIPDLKGNPS